MVGTVLTAARLLCSSPANPAIILPKEPPMSGVIYLVGLIVVVMAILSFIGIH